jgi:hypothetical protein
MYPRSCLAYGVQVNVCWPWKDKPHGLMNLGVLLLRLADQLTTRLLGKIIPPVARRL